MTDAELINRLLAEFPPRPDRTGKLLLDAERAAQTAQADTVLIGLEQVCRCEEFDDGEHCEACAAAVEIERLRHELAALKEARRG